MPNKLNGKVAIVTGSSKGLGASIALHLAKEGASVVVNYSSSKSGADKIVSEITKNNGKAISIQANMANENDIKRLFSEAKKSFGKLDILVNNAGIYVFNPIEKLTVEEYHRSFDLNVLGIFLAIREAVNNFANGGTIINISSVVSTYGPAELSIYSATKGAVDSLTRSLSKELGPRNIRVNSVSPGMIETEGTHSAGIMDSEFRKFYESQASLKRVGQPQDIAKAVVFLASDDASWITGETISVNGGFR